MRGYVVSLREDGAFEARAQGGATVRVLLGTGDRSHQWVAMSQRKDGVEWEVVEPFHSLDKALSFAAAVATDQEKAEFIVRLPDGVSFRCNGRKSAEEIMASAGWYYVTDIIGFVMHSTDSEKTQFDVRAEVQALIKSDTIRLGSVNMTDEDETGYHWCADVTSDFSGWMQLDSLPIYGKTVFSDLGLEVIPHFDFRTRTNISPTEAVILQFPSDRAVRAA